MAIDFTLTPEQKVIRLGARDFAQTVLAPIVQAVDEEPDPLRAFQMMKPAYVEASKRGMAWAMPLRCSITRSTRRPNYLGGPFGYASSRIFC